MTRPPGLRRRAVLLGAAALAGARASASPVATHDDAGMPVALPSPARRVVALGHHAYAQLAALELRPIGAFANPAFAAMERYLFADPTRIPSVVHADWSPEPEIIALLRPDLILAFPDRNLRQLSLIAPVFAVADHRTLEAAADNLRRIAAVTAREPEAGRALATLDARLQRLRAATAGRPRPSALWINPHGGEISIAGRDHLTHRMMALFCDVPAPPGAGWLPASVEALLAIDPDAILLSNWDGLPEAEALARLRADPLWSRLRALRTSRLRLYPDYQDLSVRGVPTALRLLDVAPTRINPDLSL